DLGPKSSVGARDDAPASRSGTSAKQVTHESERVAEIVVAAPDGKKRVPFSVVVEPSGAVVVFSFLPGGASVLDRFDAKGAHAGTLATFEPGDAPGRLTGPAGVAVDGQGNFYVPDADRHKVLKFDPRGKLLAELGGEGTEPGQLLGPRDV